MHREQVGMHNTYRFMKLWLSLGLLRNVWLMEKDVCES